MKTRILSGLIIAVVCIGLIFLPTFFTFVVALAASLLACYELFNSVGMARGLIGYATYGVILLYYILLVVHRFSYMSAAVLCFIVLMGVYVFTYPKEKFTRVAVAMFGFFYCGILLSYLFLIKRLPFGSIIMPVVFIAAWINDTCAYFIGYKFGKHKLAPVLSPKKSIEGFVGGVLGAAVIGAIYGFVVSKMFPEIGSQTLTFFLTAFWGAIISVLGDLTASAIKRDRKIKDYGNIIPGHGGILDRFDSMIFAAPVVYFVVIGLWLRGIPL